MSPDRSPRVPGTPDEWMEFARSDLRLARLAEADETIRREQICFHAQQAAEKAIKAVLVFRGIGFPLTHDLEELLRLAEDSCVTLPEAVRKAGLLTPYAVETRYPGYWTAITKAEVTEALDLAEAIVAWAKAITQTE